MNRLEVAVLDRAYQPTTINPDKLKIGIAKVTMQDIDMGAITNATFEMVTQLKERYIGYPAQRNEVYTESVMANVGFTCEEVGSVRAFSIIENLINNLEAQTSINYSLGLEAPFVTGDVYKLGVTGALLPNLTLDWKNDWCNLALKFECVANNAEGLVSKSTLPGVGEQTRDVRDLTIGLPKLLINNSSVGAVQQVSLNISGSVKKIETGMPRCCNKVIYLDSKVELIVVVEELELVPTDSATVVFEQTLLNGKVLRITFPTCKIANDMGLVTGNDWVGYKHRLLPFKSTTGSLMSMKLELP